MKKIPPSSWARSELAWRRRPLRLLRLPSAWRAFWGRWGAPPVKRSGALVQPFAAAYHKVCMGTCLAVFAQRFAIRVLGGAGMLAPRGCWFISRHSLLIYMVATTPGSLSCLRWHCSLVEVEDVYRELRGRYREEYVMYNLAAAALAQVNLLRGCIAAGAWMAEARICVSRCPCGWQACQESCW
jgi:hypothetical protein